MMLGVVEVAAPAPPKPIEICATCGVVRRDDRAKKCAHCHAPHTSVALSAPRAADAMWVGAECTFKCRACGFVVPLNHLDMDGAVTCARCGSEQAFEVRAWHDALELAHAVADGTTSPPGTQTSVKQTLATENTFEITLSAGHPLCESCHAMLEVAFDAAQPDAPLAKVTCAPCKTSASYGVPRAASRMTKGALRGAIAAEHRADRAAVKVDQSPTAIAIQCPSCSAPLDAGSESKVVQCKYCNTTSRIPDGAWFRMSGKEPKAETMWLAFSGPSHTHSAAEDLRVKKAHDAELHRLRVAKQAYALQMREVAAIAQRSAEAEAARAAQGTQARGAPTAELAQGAATALHDEQRRSKGTWVIAVVVGVVALASGAYALLQR
jgi:hypothetical protein